LHGFAPVYLSELCKLGTVDQYRVYLRSANDNALLVPRHRLAIYGPRAFCTAGLKAWNALPAANLRNPELNFDGCFVDNLIHII
jgi:hypothetical protein